MIVWCDECDEVIDGEPVQDEGQVFWIGKRRAQNFCSLACLDEASERYGMAVLGY